MTDAIKALVSDFSTRIQEVTMHMAREEVMAALEPRVARMERTIMWGLRRARSRVAGVEATTRLLVKVAKTKRRKGPIQLCPAPGCKGRAAPAFGMVCGDHKGTPKATVAKWREARRRKKAASRN